MEKFQVLPTEERFQNLTDGHINFIIESMSRDSWEIEQQSKGRSNVMEDADNDFLNVPEEDFNPLPDFLDAKDLQRQAMAKLSESERKKYDERIKAEFEDGDQNAPDLHHESIMEQIRKNIEELDDELKNGKFKEEKSMTITKDSIKDALEQFDNDDDYI